MIWDGQKATFKGNPKLAGLHCLQQKNSTTFRVMTWRREGLFLRQLSIGHCNACNFSGHYCNGRCCAIPVSEFAAVENPYVKLALMTCKQNAASLADMKTCNGRECYTVEKALPGSYVWFGIPEMSGPPNVLLSKHNFLRYWTRESTYGVHSFVVDIHTMISAYRQQIANGRQVVLRCGGTLLYTCEVCYVVIVTHEGDSVHDNLPTVTSPLSAGDRSPRCNWSRLLDQNGHCTCTQNGYPQFMPHHVQRETSFIWDHVVFAFHLPNGATLSIPRKDLIEEGPLHTEHTMCHKFRRYANKSVEVCAEEEARYQSHTQSTDMSGINLDELFSSFEDNDSGLQSTPEADNHLTGSVEPVQNASQEDVVAREMAHINVEELCSSFEDTDNSAENVLPIPSQATPQARCQSTEVGTDVEHVQNKSQRPLVGIAGSISEEVFAISSFIRREPAARSTPRLCRKRSHCVPWHVSSETARRPTSCSYGYLDGYDSSDSSDSSDGSDSDDSSTLSDSDY